MRFNCLRIRAFVLAGVFCGLLCVGVRVASADASLALDSQPSTAITRYDISIRIPEHPGGFHV